MNGSLVVLMGFDGCGKTTVLDRLHSDGIATVSWRELRHESRLSFMRPAFVTPGAFRYQLPAQTRACYTLLAAFAEYELLAAPRLKQEHMVVIESYFMRTIAKELVKGVADPALLALASLLPPPQAIIWLDVPASVAYQRKRGSLGVFEYLKTPTLDDFAHFQSTVLRSALDLAETARIHKIDATRQPDIVYREVLKHLLPYGQQ